MDTSTNNIFRRILNESFDDDYADYQAKSLDHEKSRKRASSGEDTLSKIDKRKMTFDFYGKKYYLKRDYNWIDVKSADGQQIVSVKNDYDANKQIQKIAQAIYEDVFGEKIGNMALWECFTTEDFDHLEKTAKLYKELLGVVSSQKSKYDSYYSDEGEHSKLNQASMNRYSKLSDTWKAKTDAEEKAKQSLYDETPDYEEGGYAVWNSKNGKRKVTVVSVDEPNQRAKINTDKGATMYVPLDTLDKYVDYGEYF